MIAFLYYGINILCFNHYFFLNEYLLQIGIFPLFLMHSEMLLKISCLSTHHFVLMISLNVKLSISSQICSLGDK